ncbi:MAG TPA: hypothetical protein P5511_03490 [Candidatus Goldiibacteriota bacterium]|nr:hypothetical protein [Candidatus Goldiibacteriota bacterium]
MADDMDKNIEADMLKFMQMKHLSAQEKYNEIQKLAKKYNMPLETLLKKIITGWVNEDKEKKFSQKPKGINKIL